MGLDVGGGEGSRVVSALIPMALEATVMNAVVISSLSHPCPYPSGDFSLGSPHP